LPAGGAERALVPVSAAAAGWGIAGGWGTAVAGGLTNELVSGAAGSAVATIGSAGGCALRICRSISAPSNAIGANARLITSSTAVTKNQNKRGILSRLLFIYFS
jgi:hypothetical protein